jgi:hypothetical protein
METTIVSELCHTNKLHSAQMEPNSGANLAANRSTARRWIQAEATVISLANILTMLGNCSLHKRKISYVVLEEAAAGAAKTFRQCAILLKTLLL